MKIAMSWCGTIAYPALMAAKPTVLCNPPFHQRQAVSGKLRIVGNRHLGYHIKLTRLFGYRHRL